MAIVGRYRNCFGALIGLGAMLGLPAAAHAALTVTTAPTKHVTCAAGVCTATAAKASLNVTDLQAMLAASDVTLIPGSMAGDIDIVAPVTWTSANTLTLDAYHSIVVEQPVTAQGTSGMTLLTNDGGSGGALTFFPTGSASFWDTASSLSLNGTPYTLVSDIATLASGIAANPSGHFALAKPYDAGADGIYAHSPITTTFEGDFEGLGNAIANLSIQDAQRGDNIGLFSEIDRAGVVEGIRLNGVVLKSNAKDAWFGALAGVNLGLVRNASSAGILRPSSAAFGGLVSDNWGTIADSFSTIDSRGGGGLVEINGTTGVIDSSYATGNVETLGLEGLNGGLVQENYGGVITNCYATGNVFSDESGGLVGDNSAPARIANSYAIGMVGPTMGSGGVVGSNRAGAVLVDDYWDTSTAQENAGCGYGACTGATGLTDTQLKSGLPSGFDPAVWGRNAKINNGYPYLLLNPPPPRK